MPRKYVPKTKKYRKRPRRNLRKQGTMLSMYKAPMPNKFAAKLRYQDSAVLNAGIGVPGLHIVSTNGCYDPNISNLGHQPRGFDQFMTMYDHYTVIGSKITATFCLREGIAYDNIHVGIACRDATTVVNINNYLEGRNVVSKVLRGSDGAGTTSHVITLSKTCSTRKFLGRSHPLSDPELKGSSTSNPTEQAYYHLFAQAIQGLGTSDFDVTYRIDYLVVFSEPKQPAQS